MTLVADERIDGGSDATGVGDASDAAPEGRAADRIIEHRWWGLVAWAVGLAMGAGSLSDNSFLTHLATGRLIRSSGAPSQDLFTFASGGKHLVVQSWLASWWYATLEAVGGAALIRVFVAGCTGLLLATLWRLSRPAGAIVPRLGLVATAGLVGLLWWNERPQVVAFLALALIAVVVTERRSPWWLVPLFALWVNVHGSFPLGVLYVGCAIALRCHGRVWRIGRRELGEVAAMAVGVVGGAALSPYGFELLTFPIRLLARSSSLILISEWRPLDFGTVNNVVFALQVVGVLALLAWRRAWLPLLVAGAFVGLALMAVRNGAVAGIVLVPVAAPALAGLGTPDREGPAPRRSALAVGLVAALVVGLLIAATPDVDDSAYPVAAVDWLEAHGLVGRPHDENARILTHDYSGNYLEWRYGTRALPWFDDRAELHSFETVRDYVLLLSGIGDPADLLGRHPHDLVMWSTEAPLARYLSRSRDYRIVYRDDSTIVACRVASGRC